MLPESTALLLLLPWLLLLLCTASTLRCRCQVGRVGPGGAGRLQWGREASQHGCEMPLVHCLYVHRW